MNATEPDRSTAQRASDLLLRSGLPLGRLLIAYALGPVAIGFFMVADAESEITESYVLLDLSVWLSPVTPGLVGQAAARLFNLALFTHFSVPQYCDDRTPRNAS